MKPRHVRFWMGTSACLLLLWLATAGFLALLLIRGSTAASSDGRTAVFVTPGEKDLILAEMRLLLLSVNGMHEALAMGDRAAAAASLRKSGMSMVQGLAEQEVAIMRKLPAPMKKLGIGTHEHFDILADRLENGSILNERQLHTNLKELTDRCVACHAAYRLELETSQKK